MGDLDLDPVRDADLVPTTAGGTVRCIRPEPCVLDRLALVAGSQTRTAFLQAAAVTVAQAGQPAWDQDWIESGAQAARLGRLWKHLKRVLERGNPTEPDMDRAVRVGWDPPPERGP